MKVRAVESVEEKSMQEVEKELLDKKFSPVIHKDDIKEVAEGMQLLYSPPYNVYIEHRAKTKFGWRWIAWMRHASSA